MGWPSAFTTRPMSASPTGTDMMRPVRRTSSPSLISVIFAQQHRPHLVFFQVQGDARDVMRNLDHLPGHHFFQAVYAGDALADRDHRSGLGNADSLIVVLNFIAQQARGPINMGV